MFAGVMDELLYNDYMIQRAPFWTLAWILALAQTTNTMIFFFQNSQNQGNLFKEPHLSYCSSPRSAACQICMRRRPEGDIPFKSFKKW